MMRDIADIHAELAYKCADAFIWSSFFGMSRLLTQNISLLRANLAWCSAGFIPGADAPVYADGCSAGQN